MRKRICVYIIGCFLLQTATLCAAGADVMWKYKESQKDILDVALSHYNRGLYLELQEDREGALAAYEKALLMTPDFPEARNNRGAVLYDLNRFEEAIVAFRQALDLRPDFTAAHLNLGHAYFAMSRFTDALEEFRKVTELSPEITQAYYYCGLCYNQINEFGQAIKMLEIVVDRENDNAAGHYHLASNLFAAKRFERALFHYRRVLEIDPDFEDAAEINMIILGIEKLGF